MAPLHPYLLGRGRAGAAIEMALRTLAVTDPELPITPPVWLPRGAPLEKLDQDGPAVLFIANPHGLHARTILEAERAGISHIACEKPVCVSLEEAEALRAVKATVAVFHGYRTMWGPRTLRKMIDAGELGEIIALEGTYWQSSAAQRALSEKAAPGWKDDPKLAGNFDTLTDIASHWVDLAAFLVGEMPVAGRGWLSYANAPSPHRDTHAQLQFSFPRGARAMVSASKNFHGGTNRLEMHVLGTRKAASWSFLSPDEIVVGEGANRGIIARTSAELGARLPAFHAMGWTDGYVEIARQLCRAALGRESLSFPTLSEALAIMSFLLKIPYERSA